MKGWGTAINSESMSGDRMLDYAIQQAFLLAGSAG